MFREKKKKVSLLLKIAGVRWFRQKTERMGEDSDHKEREKERSFEGFGEKGGLMPDEQQKVRQQPMSLSWEINLTFHPELPPVLSCWRFSFIFFGCFLKFILQRGKEWHSWGNKEKERGQSRVASPHTVRFIIASPIISCLWTTDSWLNQNTCRLYGHTQTGLLSVPKPKTKS